MAWHITSDVESFAAAAGPWLGADPVPHTLPLTLVEEARTGGWRGGARFGWYGDPVEAAFVQTPGRGPVIAGPPATAAALAELFADEGTAIPTVNGLPEVAHAFADAWRGRRGGYAEEVMRVRLYRLAELADLHPPPPGWARPATRADLGLVIGWSDACRAELRESPGDTSASPEERLRRRPQTLWLVAGEPVAMAGHTPPLHGMARIGPVYTPPRWRRRGYGAAVTAAVSAALRAAGVPEVVLYTALDNPTSHSVYRRVGFRPAHERVVLALRD